MRDRCQQLAVGDLVAAEFIGDDHPRHVLEVFEQRAEESFGGHRISANVLDILVQCRVPLIRMNTSSQCHLSPGRGRRRRSPLA